MTYLLISITIIVFIIMAIYMNQNANAKAKAAAAYKEKVLVVRVEKLRKQAAQLIDQASLQIRDAILNLDKAEEEYAENFYAPFWDLIEKSANNLASYNNNICALPLI